MNWGPVLVARYSVRDVCLFVAVRLEALDLDARDPVVGRHRDRALPRAFDFSDGGEHVALDLSELLVRDLAELEAHLGFEELLAQR